ncbi:MAG: flagellar filament capping protein FliD [Treponema sp.]|uniref:flagellar filament capping protein FliD n=1 Tax=Treponema sp. TaxID=166 RepID=UPI001D7F330D|nr:flagellar filament capping protein FliD [Treponema sp.]MBS7309646.1 flagellar filament capping protein FliD [Treponema sp.]
MAGLSIPGVNDKYKSNEIVEGLMKVERIPLTREQNHLEEVKKQQDAWRTVNHKMSQLRDSVKSLYSFDNPFNNKLASSTEEYAITATAGREAAYESFQIEVIQPATADRFLSGEIEKNQKIPAGTYTFKTGDKTISMNWKGGKIEDFVTSLNKRGKDVIKASLIGINKGNKALLLESLKTGSDSHLEFKDAALTLAIDTKMIQKVEGEKDIFGSTLSEIKVPENVSPLEQEGMPFITSSFVKMTEDGISIPPRGGFTINVPGNISKDTTKTLIFTVKAKEINDITDAANSKPTEPDLPDPGNVTFQNITIDNNQSSYELPGTQAPKIPLESIRTDSVLFARFEDGTERELKITDAFSEGGSTVKVNLSDYSGIKSIVMRNANTGIEYSVSKIESVDEKASLGYTPVNAVSNAGDAIIKYEGITITRPDNKIDDVIPHITLNVSQKTERPATIKIEPDTEAAKDALINFVGRYNQIIAEINILSQNKPELISELDYLSQDEEDAYKEKLGLFSGDFSLTNAKSSMQDIIGAVYQESEYSEITMLSQIGISTNATNYSGYNPTKMRGYLEINEKILDETLKNNLDSIKTLFGYDSDGDLIIDSGIGVRLDKQLTAYVQSGGILANKNSTLDRQVKASEQKIARLETQLNQKEAELKAKYGQMESTLNSLEGQSNSINNFTQQQNRNR